MTWVPPEELKAEANGLKRQPDDIPVPPTPGFDEVEGGISDGAQAVIDRANEVAAIVESEITNHAEATG